MDNWVSDQKTLQINFPIVNVENLSFRSSWTLNMLTVNKLASIPTCFLSWARILSRLQSARRLPFSWSFLRSSARRAARSAARSCPQAPHLACRPYTGFVQVGHGLPAGTKWDTYKHDLTHIYIYAWIIFFCRAFIWNFVALQSNILLRQWHKLFSFHTQRLSGMVAQNDVQKCTSLPGVNRASVKYAAAFLK